VALIASDRQAITDLINMHGHLTDRGAFDRMDELFTPDAEFDLSDFGLGVQTGLAAMNDAIRAVPEHPVGHHVTNIVLSEGDDGTVHAISKGIGIGADGHCGSVVYEDVLRAGPAGWRIARRTIRMRRVPLQA
jgi:SnoaL-like domain